MPRKLYHFILGLMISVLLLQNSLNVSSQAVMDDDEVDESSTDTSTEEVTDDPDDPYVDPLSITCKKDTFNKTLEVRNTTLKCYHCNSTTKEANPKCDSFYWRYLKYNQKTRMRVTCDTGADIGKFCIKLVKKRFAERITERGCYKDVIQKSNNQTLKTHVGCYYFKKDGYITSVCFCDKNFCNGGHTPGTKLAIYLYLLLPTLIIPMFV